MKAILASTSTLYGEKYLSYLLPVLDDYFKDVKDILFIPYARPGGVSHDDYTAKVQEAFLPLGKKITGIHTLKDISEEIKNFPAIFTGGGNTFLLVKTLHELHLMDQVKSCVENGALYLGCSAGSNIGGISMKTTNDMPIVLPPSFSAMGLIPFNINPHYLDPDPNSTHNGETRETRIKEFHTQEDTPVLGIREGSWIELDGKEIFTRGKYSTRLFRAGEQAVEIAPDTLILS